MANGPLLMPNFAPGPDEGNLMVTEMKRSNVSQPEDRHVARAPRSTDVPFLQDGELLDVQNDGRVPVVFRWARKSYIVQPGQSTFVPFEALANQLGDPRSVENAVIRYDDGVGNRGQVAPRYDELCRLFAMYGVENESMPDLVLKAPKVSVHTMTGVHVPFPSQLPDMTPIPTANVDNGNVNSDVTRMFDSLKSENEDLKVRLEKMEAHLEAQYAAAEGLDSQA